MFIIGIKTNTPSEEIVVIGIPPRFGAIFSKIAKVIINNNGAAINNPV